ncbi:DUF2953 domain-containing protein [Aeribacillus sp. FSL M8-0235]|uniref:DUF2953 domain-containing protein n=1 Tax=Aeribacillus sp. FSL M8-0235 TaxID=2954576 RepID=UPI0030F6B0B0
MPFWLAIVFFLFLIFVLLVAMTKLTIVLSYKHDKYDDRLRVTFLLFFGLIRYTIKIPFIKLDQEGPNIVYKQEKETKHSTQKSSEKVTPEELFEKLQNFKEILENVIHFSFIIRKFLKKVRIVKWEWRTEIGTGEAASTGMSAGTLWGMKSSIIYFASLYFTLIGYPVVSIFPNFNRMVLKTTFVCMMQFRLGNAIIAGLRLVKWSRSKTALWRNLPFAKKNKKNEHSLEEAKV